MFAQGVLNSPNSLFQFVLPAESYFRKRVGGGISPLRDVIPRNAVTGHNMLLPRIDRVFRDCNELVLIYSKLDGALTVFSLPTFVAFSVR